MVHFLLFQQPMEVAVLLRLCFVAIGFERIEDTCIDLLFRAVLFKKELGGIDSGVNEEPKELSVYNDVFVLVDRFSCVPICLIDSMLMTVREHGKIYVQRVTFNTHMIAKIVEYIIDDVCWPVHMTKDEMIASACTHHSMRCADLFDADVPLGLSGHAAWYVYELPMAAHGFIAYCFEIYIVVAADLGPDALDVVKAFFASFARGDGDVFDLHNGWGICGILKVLDNGPLPLPDVETIDEQVTWVLALLDDLLHMPRLTVDELPEIVDMPMGFEELITPSPEPPNASNTPLSALYLYLLVSSYTRHPTAEHFHPRLLRLRPHFGRPCRPHLHRPRPRPRRPLPCSRSRPRRPCHHSPGLCCQGLHRPCLRHPRRRGRTRLRFT